MILLKYTVDNSLVLDDVFLAGNSTTRRVGWLMVDLMVVNTTF